MEVGQPDYKQVSFVDANIRTILPYPSGVKILTDDWEHGGQTWYVQTSGGGSAAVSAAASYMGSNSCKLIAGNVADYWTTIAKDVGLTRTSRVGFEVVYQMPATKGNYICFHIGYGIGVIWYQGWLLYDIVVQHWYYWTPVEGFVACPNGAQDLRVGVGGWHKMKLMVDYAKNEYIIGFSDNIEFDLTGLALYQDVWAQGESLGVGIEVAATDNSQPAFYIDQLTVTEEKV